MIVINADIRPVAGVPSDFGDPSRRWSAMDQPKPQWDNESDSEIKLEFGEVSPEFGDVHEFGTTKLLPRPFAPNRRGGGQVYK